MANPDGFASTRLGVTFTLKTGELRVYGPDGVEWVMPDKDIRGHMREKARRETAERERDGERAEREKADQARVAAAARAEKFAAKLRALGLDPDAE